MPRRVQLPAEPAGLLIRKDEDPLFSPSLLISAATECGLLIKGDVAVEQIALQLSDDVVDALSLACARKASASAHDRAQKLRVIERAVCDLMIALDLSPDSRPGTARFSASLRDLLRPGLCHPPAVALQGRLVCLAGGAERLQEEIADHQAFIGELGLDEAGHVVDGKLTEALIDVLPSALSAIRHTAAAALQQLDAPPKGRPHDYAVGWVMRAIAKAHLTLFGFAPQLQTPDREEEITPSVVWSAKVLKGSGRRLQKLNASGGEDAPEVLALDDIARLAPRTIRDLLGEARQTTTAP